MDMSSTHIGEPEDVKPLGIADPRLCAVLQSLSLHEYTEALVAHGFTTWDQLLDIQEHHLEALKFKLGHRRKLQREIAVCKNIKSLKDQIERPQDGAELAAIHTPTIRPEKRRLDDTEQFQGMHKRFFGQGSLVNVEDDDGHCADGGSMSWLNRQMTLHSLISADPTALSSTSHFTVVKDRCSTISLRMPVIRSSSVDWRGIPNSATIRLVHRPTLTLVLTASVICVYILPKMADSNSQDTLHFAVYLKSRTLDEFIQLIANRCNMLSHQILRTIRIDKTGVEMAFNDTMVRQIMEEQVMIAEFRDIGLPPHFHPSFADVAGFGELKSRFFELRLRY
ncbi:hypothetical protein EG328_009847 [Venturia inaequalis]|uniref:SAM domain-containing protein n=1 Tax=Venturia inaequalis TaxID=5025 RepID=A0A8H3V5G2_VENIN|nr:hypothetical protein EG328_009847 [Venturia inaequalis]